MRLIHALYKEDEKGVCIIIIYIDDMLIIGKEEAIDDAIKVLQGHFQVKDPTSLEDYLGVQMAQVTEMYRVINFVLETKTLGLRMVPIFNDGIWKLEALSDSDFANDKDTMCSVYGYIIYFCGVPVVWNSKSMKNVVLSTTEAEYVAVSEVVKEIKFLYLMLRSMEIKVPLPIKVQVDNVGAIWLANNSSVSERTKHVDWRAHFVRDMIKDEVIEINFVKSAENDSYIMTKNQQGQLYMYTRSKLVYTVQEMNEKRDIEDEETGRMLES